jgi:hypothetical protein
MRRPWCTTTAALGAAVALAMAGADAAGPCVALHLAAPGPAAAASPAFVELRDLPVPAAGATIVVNARARGLSGETRIATLFVVGSSRSSATVTRTLQGVLQTAPDVADTIARDARATITVLVCRAHETGNCTTVGPLPVTVERSSG